MSNKQINPNTLGKSNKRHNPIRRFSVGLVGVGLVGLGVVVGSMIVGAHFFLTDTNVFYTEHQGLKVERSGPTAFWGGASPRTNACRRQSALRHVLCQLSWRHDGGSARLA